MPHTLIFDIGKTNKKAFVFDEDYQEISKEYTHFPEKTDEDGFPCDDLVAIQSWMQDTLHSVFKKKEFDITAINFSTYGASLVHLDAQGKVLTPLYNYLKPLPEDAGTEFYASYGPIPQLARETASPALDGLLNSGLQLYWLKKKRPHIFKRIRWSLHFPQYLSYLLTGIPLSEYTSIGCHTMLWDFTQNDYHNWVSQEEITKILPPIVPTNTSINTRILGKKVRVGIGIHDSSAALLPYLRADKKPFLLISTGTWSIALNPFSQDDLSREDLEQDCLNFLRIDGQVTRAARLFLGKEYSEQAKALCRHFGLPENAHQTIPFNAELFQPQKENSKKYFRFEHLNLPHPQPERNHPEEFATFEMAYHQLMRELVEVQVQAAQRAKGNTDINKLYIDGGFTDNDLFVNMLSHYLPEVKLRTTKSPLGSALGAALVIADKGINKKFLKKHYAMKKIKREN